MPRAVLRLAVNGRFDFLFAFGFLLADDQNTRHHFGNVETFFRANQIVVKVEVVNCLIRAARNYLNDAAFRPHEVHAAAFFFEVFEHVSNHVAQIFFAVNFFGVLAVGDLNFMRDAPLAKNFFED